MCKPKICAELGCGKQADGCGKTLDCGVRLTETTWGYQYAIKNVCAKAAAQGFDWSREIVPGVYKVEVFGSSTYASFPIHGTQVVVPKIARK